MEYRVSELSDRELQEEFAVAEAYRDRAFERYENHEVEGDPAGDILVHGRQVVEAIDELRARQKAAAAEPQPETEPPAPPTQERNNLHFMSDALRKRARDDTRRNLGQMSVSRLEADRHLRAVFWQHRPLYPR